MNTSEKIKSVKESWSGMSKEDKMFVAASVAGGAVISTVLGAATVKGLAMLGAGKVLSGTVGFCVAAGTVDSSVTLASHGVAAGVKKYKSLKGLNAKLK